MIIWCCKCCTLTNASPTSLKDKGRKYCFPAPAFLKCNLLGALRYEAVCPLFEQCTKTDDRRDQWQSGITAWSIRQAWFSLVVGELQEKEDAGRRLQLKSGVQIQTKPPCGLKFECTNISWSTMEGLRSAGDWERWSRSKLWRELVRGQEQRHRRSDLVLFLGTGWTSFKYSWVHHDNLDAVPTWRMQLALFWGL